MSLSNSVNDLATRIATEINSVRNEVEAISLTPGAQGPAGPQGVPGDAAVNIAFVASTSNLAGIYDATLQKLSVNGTSLTVDGVNLSVGDIVLVKDQSTDLQNGVYEVTGIGVIGSQTTYPATATQTGTQYSSAFCSPGGGAYNNGYRFNAETGICGHPNYNDNFTPFDTQTVNVYEYTCPDGGTYDAELNACVITTPVSTLVRFEEFNDGNIVAVSNGSVNASTTWSSHGSIFTNLKGDTGATGPQGPQGEVGNTGPAGADGSNGSDGATGPQGPQGEKGDTGDSGIAIATAPITYDAPTKTVGFSSGLETIGKALVADGSGGISWATLSGGSAGPSMPSTTTDGAIWLDTDGTSSLSQETRWRKTLAAGVTEISGNDDISSALIYQSTFEKVFLNGVLLVRGADYTATNGTSITLTEASLAGDVIEIFTSATFNVANTYTIAQADAAFGGTAKSLADQQLMTIMGAN